MCYHSKEIVLTKVVFFFLPLRVSISENPSNTVHWGQIYQHTVYISILLNLLKSTLSMLELGDRIEHCNFLTKFPFLYDSIVGMTIGIFTKYSHNSIFDR